MDGKLEPTWMYLRSFWMVKLGSITYSELCDSSNIGCLVFHNHVQQVCCTRAYMGVFTACCEKSSLPVFLSTKLEYIHKTDQASFLLIYFKPIGEHKC